MRRPTSAALAALACALLASPAAFAAPTALIGRYSPGNAFSTFDAASGSLGPGSAVDGGVIGVAIAADGRTGWVAVDGATAGALLPVDLATGTGGAGVTLPAGIGPFALTPDGTRAVVPIRSANTVVVVDLAARTAGPPVAAGLRPTVVVVDPVGRYAYVGDAGTGSDSGIAIVDLAGVEAPVIIKDAVFDRVQSLAITPDGRTLYAGNFGAAAGGQTVVPFDIAARTIGTPVTVGKTVARLAIDPTGTRLYTTNRETSTISVIDTAANTVVQTLSYPGVKLWGIAITPSGDRAILTDTDGGTVRRIALPGGEVIGTPTPLGDATDIAIEPARTPVPVFTVGGPAVAGQPVAFDASATTSAGGGLAWSFGDGDAATGTVAQHAYAAPGTYTATLTATNDCHPSAVRTPGGIAWAGSLPRCVGPRTAVATQTVTVAAPAKPVAKRLPPLARACVSVRDFTIRLKKGVRARRVSVTIDGRPARVSLGRRIRARINLRGTPKKIVTVKIVVTPRKGKAKTTLRRYRTCAKKKAGRNVVKL